MKIDTENLVLLTPENEPGDFSQALDRLIQVSLLPVEKDPDLSADNPFFSDESQAHFEDSFRNLCNRLDSDIMIEIRLKNTGEDIGMIVLSTQEQDEIEAGYVFYSDEDLEKYSNESLQTLIPLISSYSDQLSVDETC